MDRDFYELVNKRQRPEEVPPRRTRVQAATLGFVRDLALLADVETGLGGDVTLYGFNSRLNPVYGKNPVSIHGFLRIRFGSHASMPDSDRSHMKM